MSDKSPVTRMWIRVPLSCRHIDEEGNPLDSCSMVQQGGHPGSMTVGECAYGTLDCYEPKEGS